MSDAEMIRLLEEIRDLQKQQVETSAQLLANQAEAIRIQRDAVKRGRRFLLPLAVVIGVIIVIVLLLLRYVLTRYS